jgi:hypothetical protein
MPALGSREPVFFNVKSVSDEAAVRAFDRALGWLRDTYPTHGFGVERDVVWTLAKRLVADIRDQGLTLKVWTDYPVERGPRRAWSADIAVVGTDAVRPRLVAEFKFEPSHRRPDVQPQKLPVIGWGDVTKDAVRVERWVREGFALFGIAVLLDEGGFFARRPALPGGSWHHWADAADSFVSPAIHRADFGPQRLPAARDADGTL